MMSISTWVIALDPVDPRVLFDAARSAAGDPQDCVLHDGPDCDVIHMWMTHDNEGADARVAVHFPAAGGPYPPEGTRAPDGYAYAGFFTGAFDDNDGLRRHHAELVRKLGQWLDARGIRWCWSYEGGPWIHGGVAQVPGGVR